jgi:hypothetical protein
MMDKKTLKALKKSIIKWEKNVKNAEYNKEHDEHIREIVFASNDCPLCKLFYIVHCIGCPISDKTAKRYCKSTPYSYVESYLDRGYFKACENACRKEVKFLKSLLSFHGNKSSN